MLGRPQLQAAGCTLLALLARSRSVVLVATGTASQAAPLPAPKQCSACRVSSTRSHRHERCRRPVSRPRHLQQQQRDLRLRQRHASSRAAGLGRPRLQHQYAQAQALSGWLQLLATTCRCTQPAAQALPPGLPEPLQRWAAHCRRPQRWWLQQGLQTQLVGLRAEAHVRAGIVGAVLDGSDVTLRCPGSCSALAPEQWQCFSAPLPWRCVGSLGADQGAAPAPVAGKVQSCGLSCTCTALGARLPALSDLALPWR